MMEEQLDNMESVLQKICIVEPKPGKQKLKTRSRKTVNTQAIKI